MTAIPLCESTSRVSASVPSLLGAAGQARRSAEIEPSLYVAALEHQAALPAVDVVLVQTDADLYLAFGDGAALVAKACPGVPLVWGDVLGRRVPVAAVELDAVDDVRQALFDAGIASARADVISDAGRTAVTFVSRPPAPALDYLEQERLLRDAAKYLPRAVRVVIAALADMDGDAQRLAMRSIVAWLRNIERHPMSRLASEQRPALPTRHTVALFLELLTHVPAEQHETIIPLLRRVIGATASAPGRTPLRIAHNPVDDGAGFDECVEDAPVEAGSMILRAGGTSIA